MIVSTVMKLCRHLEVSGFSSFTVDFGGTTQIMTLQKCSDCDEYLTLDGLVVPSERILSRETSTKAKMRTITAQLNSGLYEKLEALAASETGSKDPSKILNEVVGIGLKHYKHNLN